MNFLLCKKAQSSIEFMIILAVVVVVALTTLYVLLTSSEGLEDKTDDYLKDFNEIKNAYE